MVPQRAVSVTVPATSANLGPGFDCLGLALELRNEFTFQARGWVARPEEVRLMVEVEGEGARTLPRDEENLVYRAACAVFAATGRYPAHLSLRLHGSIPVGKGLGSSASAIVGGVWGAVSLAEEPLSDERRLALATRLEGHPDNIVPAVMGGFTVAVAREAGEAPLHWSIPVARPLIAVVAIPSFSVRTAEARRRLPRQVPLRDAVFNLSHTAAVVAAALQGDWPGAASAMEDRLHQPYRAPLVPGFAEVCAAAREAGAAAVVLSGAGPSVLALVVPGEGAAAPAGPELAAQVGRAMEAAFGRAGVQAQALVLEPARQGVRVTVEEQV